MRKKSEKIEESFMLQASGYKHKYLSKKGNAPQLPTTNHKPKTTTMETHAHHLHKAPGKKWTHYFFEFLMLFLAVFLGFIARISASTMLRRTGLTSF